VTDAALLDLRVARGAARLGMPRGASDPAAAARLRREVAEELPAIDAAARRWTRLGGDLPPVEVRVVGRMGWVEENLRVVEGVLGPVADRMGPRPAGAGQIVGAQLGGLLGLLSTRVLGQYVLPLAGDGPGQLVVVGPNVLDLGADLGPLADDLRRTVLLHEVAHRLQFEAVPWLGAHLRGIVAAYTEGVSGDATMVLDLLRRLPGAVAEAVRTATLDPVVRAMLSPEQRDVMARAQALMSLLEGHGNATMGLAAEGIVTDPAAVTAALARRRNDPRARVLRAVGGMEAKARQYSEGEAFVRAVVDDVGVDGLNRVFEGPGQLPRPDELQDPAAWVARTAA
jgi:coenzyme F420 biosynthesis associated uncharacterized protein